MDVLEVMNRLEPKLVLSAVVFAALLGACSSSTPTPTTSEHAAKPCSTDIKDYCAARTCNTYDQAVAKAHDLKVNPPASEPWSYHIGTCGSLRFVTVQRGLGVGEEYFDASGALVGVGGAADAPTVCTGEFGWSVGAKPSCQEQVAETAGGSPK